MRQVLRVQAWLKRVSLQSGSLHFIHLGILAIVVLVAVKNAVGCPFCDAGGLAAGKFILTVFGLFAGAVALVFWIFLRQRGLARAEGIGRQVLAAEGIEERVPKLGVDAHE